MSYHAAPMIPTPEQYAVFAQMMQYYTQSSAHAPGRGTLTLGTYGQQPLTRGRYGSNNSLHHRDTDGHYRDTERDVRLNRSRDRSPSRRRYDDREDRRRSHSPTRSRGYGHRQGRVDGEIFIGELPFSCCERDVRELVASYGMERR